MCVQMLFFFFRVNISPSTGLWQECNRTQVDGILLIKLVAMRSSEVGHWWLSERAVIVNPCILRSQTKLKS